MNRKLVVASVAAGFLALIATLDGCAHLPAGRGEKPAALLEDACRPGRANHEVTGSVWMSLKSKEEKGQFPASVRAVAPDQVTLEVTNLIGSREALIQVEHGSYTIDVPSRRGESSRRRRGAGSWGGIPLRWASELFLGRIPCPEDPSSVRRLQVTPDGDLIAETAPSKGGSGERFTFRFRQWAGRPWPESLHWERLGRSSQGASSVDFNFDDPEDKTGSPRKWGAKSALGEVKLRWTELQIDSSRN